MRDLGAILLGNEFTFVAQVQRATITDDPCPNNPWLAVTPTLAPSTWRPVA